MECIVFRQKIHAILVHADPLPLRMLCQRAVQAAGQAQLELPGVCLQTVRCRDGKTILQRSFQPDLFCVQCVLYRFLFGFAAGDASRQVGIGGHKAALRIIPHDLQPVGHCKIIIQRFHRFSPHSLRSAAPTQRRLF